MMTTGRQIGNSNCRWRAAASDWIGNSSCRRPGIIVVVHHTPVDPANAEGNPLDLPWEVSHLSGRPGLSPWQQAERGREKSAEAIVTLPSAELVRHSNVERRSNR